MKKITLIALIFFIAIISIIFVLGFIDLWR